MEAIQATHNEYYIEDMDYLPHDPAILVSSVNMLLRDGEFDSLEQVCYQFGRDINELKAYLRSCGFVYSEEQRQLRPVGFDGKEDVE